MSKNQINSDSSINNNEFIHVDNTPFILVKNAQNMYAIALGKNIVSKESFELPGDAVAYIEEKPWELIITSASAFMRYVIEAEKELNNSQNV